MRTNLRVLPLTLALLVAGAALCAQRRDRGDSAADLPFLGHYRSLAKTTMLRGVPERFGSVAELRATLIPDQRMRARYPEISSPETAPSGRVVEERRLVAVDCFLYAIKLEQDRDGDNDFHLIVGDDPRRNGSLLLNVEVSGVPDGGRQIAAFRAVRNRLLDLVQRSRFPTGFLLLDSPMPVRVTGSLYFDADHTAGSVGPAGYRPSTVWEIHPVSDIAARRQ